MMEFKLVDSNRRKLGAKREENEIREIFYEKWEKTNNRTKVIMDNIKTWRSREIDGIHAHANEQFRQLKMEYDRQWAIFNQKREENISIARDMHQPKVHSQPEGNDVFKQLCDACRSLEFQVAQLEDVQHQIQHPIVIATGDQARRNNQNRSNTHAHGVDSHQAQSTINETSAMGKHERNSSRSYVQLSSHGTSGLSLNTSTPDANNRSTSNINNSKTTVINAYDPNNKCQICFMIFPLNMSPQDRRQHSNEHMADAEHPNSTVL